MAAPNLTPRTPQLIAAKPCSREYGLKYTTLRDVVLRGEIPVIKVGREGSKRQAWYLDRQDVEQWILTRKERIA